MKDSKNKRTIILGIVLLGLLIIAIKMVFLPSTDNGLTSAENTMAEEKAMVVLKELASINFDTGILNDQKFQSLKSIEIPLPSLPIGKKNPFSVTSK